MNFHEKLIADFSNRFFGARKLSGAAPTTPPHPPSPQCAPPNGHPPMGNYNVAIDESRFCIPRIIKPESERSNKCRYNTVKSQCTPTADCRRYAWQIFGSKSATFGSVDNATDTCNRRTAHAREATEDPQLGLLSKCCSSSSRASRSRKSRDCKQDTRWSAAACC